MKSVKSSSGGFTLIEAIITIVILAIAMISLTSLLFPSAQRSALPHYQTRAAALGKAVANQILAVGFDEQSDPDGGRYRCGERDSNDELINCTLEEGFGPDLIPDTNEREVPAFYNDVDDYLGCWYGANAASACTNGKPLSELMGGDSAADYRNFTVDIQVVYDNHPDLVGTSTELLFKKITLRVKASSFSEYQFTAYRGNY